MNGTKQHLRAAALCMLALAGCASDPMDSGTSGGYMSSSTPSSSSTSSTGSTSSTLSTSSASPTTTSSAMTSYGVVQAIDQMQRQDVGLGAVGAAAAGGSTAMPTDRVYRVTVRMDDGTTQLIVVDSMPNYKIGDRVRYNNGTLSGY